MKQNYQLQLNLLRDQLLRDSKGGFQLFLKHHPELWLQERYGQQVTIQSPFDPVTTISIYYHDERKKWFFKDQGELGYFGDMFNYVAFLHKLDFRKDYRRILNIVKLELDGFVPPSVNTYKITNNETGAWITFFR